MKKIKKMLSVTFLAMIVVPAICIGGRIAQYQYEDKKLDQVAELVANYTCLLYTSLRCLYERQADQ